MRAFLIDPTSRTIRQVDHDGSLEAMYRDMGCDTVQCVRLIECAKLVSGLDLWMDENANLVTGKAVFELQNISPSVREPLRFAAICTVIGSNEEGECVDALVTIRDLLSRVRWTELITTGQMTRGFADHDNVFYMGVPILDLRPAEQYVIWSTGDAAYWTDKVGDYTAEIDKAARFSRDRALQNCYGMAARNPKQIAFMKDVPVRLIDTIGAGMVEPPPAIKEGV